MHITLSTAKCAAHRYYLSCANLWCTSHWALQCNALQSTLHRGLHDIAHKEIMSSEHCTGRWLIQTHRTALISKTNRAQCTDGWDTLPKDLWTTLFCRFICLCSMYSARFYVSDFFALHIFMFNTITKCTIHRNTHTTLHKSSINSLVVSLITPLTSTSFYLSIALCGLCEACVV